LPGSASIASAGDPSPLHTSLYDEPFQGSEPGRAGSRQGGSFQGSEPGQPYFAGSTEDTFDDASSALLRHQDVPDSASAYAAGLSSSRPHPQELQRRFTVATEIFQSVRKVVGEEAAARVMAELFGTGSSVTGSTSAAASWPPQADAALGTSGILPECTADGSESGVTGERQKPYPAEAAAAAGDDRPFDLTGKTRPGQGVRGVAEARVSAAAHDSDGSESEPGEDVAGEGKSGGHRQHLRSCCFGMFEWLE
jgi:hypothetical protein